MTAPSDVRRDDSAGASDGADGCPACHASVDGSWLACAFCGRPLAVDAELPSGALLAEGRFEVTRAIGRGGFGITYEVMDHRLKRRVAVKELFPDSAVRHRSMVLTPPSGRSAFAEARQRFLGEAQVLARFTHPGIVRVYEVFEEHNTAYMVMELLDGRNLLELLRARGGPFTEVEVLDVAARAAAALRSVHSAGVLHRDINPSNIILTDDGRVVVIDFGLARSYTQDRSAPVTQVVTPGYAPLEQYLNGAPLGPASDVYGLAATLYRLGTERIPVPALERQGGTGLPAPHRLNPAISKMISDGLLDGLELDVAHRPQTLDAFLQRLGLAHAARPPRSLLLDTMPPRTLAPAPSPAADIDADVTVIERGRRPVPSSDADVTVIERGRRPVPFSDADVTVGATSDDDRTLVDRFTPRPPAVGDDTDVVRTMPLPVAARAEAAGPAAGWEPPSSPGPAASAGMVPARLGLAPAGRWKLTIPAGIAVVAMASAAPVPVGLALVLLALPALATWGDSAVHRARQEAGTPRGWLERSAAAGAVAPVRFLANLVVSAIRAIPVTALSVALLGLCYGLSRLSVPQALIDAAIRGVGILIASLLVLPARRGSPRFRTGVGIDDLTVRLLGPGGRLGQVGLVIWLMAGFVTVAAWWFRPELWPFRV